MGTYIFLSINTPAQTVFEFPSFFFRNCFSHRLAYHPSKKWQDYRRPDTFSKDLTTAYEKCYPTRIFIICQLHTLHTFFSRYVDVISFPKYTYV